MDALTDPQVHASGGVVWRQSASGAIEVVLVHRPRYDDWSFPKGKRLEDETDEACAVREVEEETGLRCVLGHELLATRYRDGKDRDKLVRYWEMAVASEQPRQPDDEVDECVWVAVADARRSLTYGHDVEVLDSFARWAGVD